MATGQCSVFFFSQLERGGKLVLEQVVTTIATVADTAEEKFLHYYDRFMPNLKYIMQNALSSDYRMLRGKTIECISLIGLAVGKEKVSVIRDSWFVMRGTWYVVTRSGRCARYLHVILAIFSASSPAPFRIFTLVPDPFGTPRITQWTRAKTEILLQSCIYKLNLFLLELCYLLANIITFFFVLFTSFYLMLMKWCSCYSRPRLRWRNWKLMILRCVVLTQYYMYYKKEECFSAISRLVRLVWLSAGKLFTDKCSLRIPSPSPFCRGTLRYNYFTLRLDL